MKKKKLALVLGSGFSREAQLPITRDINTRLIVPPSDSRPLDATDDEFITAILKRYWQDVFGYHDGGPLPSLEEHFTQIDLAANSGHHLGKKYSPQILRAIRRFTIHRIFSILDASYKSSDTISKLLDMAFSDFDASIITLNWDIVVENHLYKRRHTLGLPNYEIGERWVGPINSNRPLSEGSAKYTYLRMHGSANWMYCDNCRRITATFASKGALKCCSYLEEKDFNLAGVRGHLFKAVAKSINYKVSQKRIRRHLNQSKRRCDCGSRLAGRLATFSYRKDFSIRQFQTIWKRAFEVLREADVWLIVGYSLPEADYEFKNLLKCAQLAHAHPDQLHIEATTGSPGGETDRRFQQFFGARATRLVPGYLADWVSGPINEFCDKCKP